jgi:hypothetical protein
MELVAFLRVLWRHRLVVALGALVAIGIGVIVARGPVTHTGAATRNMLLDTPTSELVDADPLGADSLGWRATFLANLMSSDAVRLRVAGEMRVPADSLVITVPSQSIPPIPLSLPVKALDAAATSASTKPLQLSISDVRPLPMIRIDARAPNRSTAARLVAVASHLLSDEAPAPVGSPAARGVYLQPLVARELGPVKSRDIAAGARRSMAAAVAVVVFALWCSAVAVVSSLARARRARAAAASEIAWLFDPAGDGSR